MHRPTDTSAEAERVLVDVYRKMSLGTKWLLLGEDYRCAQILHAAGMGQRNPKASGSEIPNACLTGNLGGTCLASAENPAMEPTLANLHVLREVTGIFDRLGIPYALRGSMASSVHGINRYTRDADLSAEPFPGKEATFAACFGPDYYLSVPAIEDAMQRRSCFNIIHTRTGFKIDVFIRKDRPFEMSALARRRAVIMPDRPAQPIQLITAEDVVLFKLEWYRQSGESVDQQWRDILGVLKVQAGRLDEGYLDQWAADLQISDLLAKARQEVQLGS